MVVSIIEYGCVREAGRLRAPWVVLILLVRGRGESSVLLDASGT